MQPAPTLKTERLILRPLAAEDAGDLFAAFGDPTAMRWLGAPHHSVAETRDLLDAMSRGESSRHWALRQHGGPAVGSLSLDWIARGPMGGGTAQIGFIVTPRWQGRGYACEAAAAVIGWAFQALALHRLGLSTDPDNRPCRRVAERLGFVPEGRTRRTLPLGEDWRDELIYGLLAEEWRTAAGVQSR